MHVSISNLMNADALQIVRAALAAAEFVDGRATAGWSATAVKFNAQAPNDLALAPVRELICDALRSHPVFAMAARPKTLIGPTFSRYVTEQYYGVHADDPIMSGVRIDIAFTLFLSDPDDYDGGELIIDTAAGEEAVKLAAGSLFLYPATTLHRVAPISRGERLAAVGWVRSYLRDPAQRELLFDLDTARHQIFAANGKTADFDLLTKCSANLMRMWCDD
jgi:PKHD-type hydroxylase